MLISSGVSNLNRFIVGLLLAALLLSSFGPLSFVSANSSSTPSTNSTSTVIDTSGSGNASSTQNSNSSSSAPSNTTTTQTTNTSSTVNGSSTPVLASSTPQASSTQNTSSTEETEHPGETTIDTGDAGAFANMINVVNTNIIDSRTYFAFMNYLNGVEGDITVPWEEDGLEGCDDGCYEGDIDIENNNEADVDNDVTVIANTGENTISGNRGTSTIVTGNAAAAANVGNLVNSNIVNSNYLLLAINSFDHLNGSLILPPASFFNNRHRNSGVTTQETNIENNNGADIANNVTTTASTGNNEITTDTEGNGGVISTGNANAVSNVSNITNTNLVNSNRMFIMVRVAGDWGGNVFSAPPGMSWIQTPNGIMLFSDGDEEPSECTSCEGSIDIENNNGASVTNNVEVYALTGDNKIETEGDEEAQEEIVTGHASAAANVYNMVNSNVIGTNYLFAMINVFGNWNGNLSFGQPDLWVGARAEMSSDPLAPGDLVTYVIDVVNRGNTDATQVKIKSLPERPEHFRAMNFSTGGGAQNDGSVMWTIPSIPAGGSARFTYQAEINDNLPGGMTLSTNEISVEGYEPESDESNNVETLSLAMLGNPVVSGRPGGSGNGTARLSLRKTNDATATLAPSSTVRYTLHVRNEGSAAAFDTIVMDTLRDPYGGVITRNGWDLGIVYPGERIEISYDVRFSEAAQTGHYINYASASATDDYYYTITNLPKASSTVYIVNPDDAPTAPLPVIQVGGGGGPPAQGVGDTPTDDEGSEEGDTEESTSDGSGGAPEAPTPPEPPQPPVGGSEDDLFDSTGESVVEGSGVEFIESFEPVREIDEDFESLLQATTSFIRSKLLASFSFLPSGAWAFFLLLLLLIAIVSRSLLEENNG